MLKDLRPALSLLVVMTVFSGVIYPLGVTALARIAFPWQAGGSLVERDGRVVGSALIGQAFTNPAYFWGRPSATTATPYDSASSGGSNLAPSSTALVEAVEAAIKRVRAADPTQPGSVPVDLVTASASGLDPHISPAAALWQAGRVARLRGVAPEDMRAFVAAHVEGRAFGILGEPRVNVLALNMALDARWPSK